MTLAGTSAITELWAKCKAFFAPSSHTHQYAGSPAAGSNADRTNAILYGTVDSTSTATVFTATVAGLTQLVDGTTVYLRNTVVTSASGFTVNVNNLGAKKCYNNMTNATADTTIFNVAYSMLFIYDSTLDSNNGGWWIYRGYDGNTNTIGYQLRGNSSTLPTSDKGYRYRLWFTSADGTKWVPANKSTSTNATASRTPNTTPINPFGPIVYYATNGTTEANANLSATTIWTQYTLSLGYSFNTTGAALVMTYPAPVYVQCTPAANGSATLDGYVQALPSSADGKIYIFLGRAYSATNIELFPEHPVYYHDGTALRLWTGKAIPTKTSELTNDSGFITDAGVTSFNGSTGAITYTAPVTSVNGSTGAVTVSVPSPGTGSSYPAMNGTRSLGSSDGYARVDHVHPTDTSRAASTHSHAISDVTDLQTALSGKAASSHEHSGADITSGTVGFSYLPTGTGASQVAIGNHSHNGYADSGHGHGNITSGGDITATAPTVASGDKLIINDESESKVTNGPAFGSSTTTFLANNGTWQTPAGSYSLPTASTSQLGGVKVDGSTITISNGVISASDVDTIFEDVSVDLGEYGPNFDDAWGSDVYGYFVEYLTNVIGWDEESPITLTQFLSSLGYGMEVFGGSEYALLSHTHTISNITNLQTTLNGKAPTSHADSSDTYGKGTSSNYGHVKLSDSTSGTAAAASGGTAATPKAVSDALASAKSYADSVAGDANQNAFSNIKVGDTTIAADSVTDTLEFVAGSNVTLTPDATNDKVTIAATDNDTKNTAGSTESSSKLYLIGATSQAANPQTYSSSQVYETNGNLHATSFNGVNIDASNGYLWYNTVASGNNGATLKIPLGESYELCEACTHDVDESISNGGTKNLPTSAAVASFVEAQMSSVAGALIYQGTVTAQSGITSTNYEKGWYWVVAMPQTTPATTSITIAGIECEAGDMVIAKQDKTSTLANDIDVVQANISIITNAEIDAITAS